MLGGLIAGALGGGAQAVSGIADQVIKEAQLAKQQAYEKGLLQWKLDEGRKDAETEREFRVANTVLDNQLRGEQQTKEFEFRAQQQKEQIAAQERQLQMQIAARERLSAKGSGGGGGGDGDLDKFPKPVKLGEIIVDPLTGAKTDVMGIPMRDGNGGMYYVDPMTMQPIVGAPSAAGGGGSGSGKGWNVEDAVAAASAGQGAATPGQSRVTPPASNSTPRQKQPQSYQQFVQEGRDRKARQQAENERARRETEERRRVNGGQDY